MLIWAKLTMCLGLAFGALFALPLAVEAQSYPDRMIKIIVPFAAGGTANAMPRVVADWLSRKWGHPVIIENKTGSAGNIGAEAVFKSDPDGYTLLSAPPPPLVINHNLYPKLGFDLTESFRLSSWGAYPTRWSSIQTSSSPRRSQK